MEIVGHLAKKSARFMQHVLALFSDDPFIHHKIAKPVVRLFSRAPGNVGAFWVQILDYLERPLRAAAAVAKFDEKVAALPKAAICLDLGANVGEYTRRLAEHAGHVHAFEPDPWAFEELSRNVGRFSNVTLHNLAVSDREGHIWLYRDPTFDKAPRQASLGSSIIPRSDGAKGEFVKVKSIALQDFLANLDCNVALIKMDIEGAEVAVLEALYNSPMRDRVDMIFVETHYNIFPEQIGSVAELKRRYQALERPEVNFDWP